MSSTAQIAPQGAQADRPPLHASKITETPEQQLALLRRAWRQRNAAEGTIERLKRYTRMTPGMKHDSNAAWAAWSEANSVLNRLLA